MAGFVQKEKKYSLKKNRAARIRQSQAKRPQRTGESSAQNNKHGIRVILLIGEHLRLPPPGRQLLRRPNNQKNKRVRI
jgi:hypothetical protein